MPLVDVLVPVDVHRLDALAGEGLGGGIHGRMMLRMPGGEQAQAFRLREAIQVGDLGEPRRRWLFEEAMEPGRKAFAGNFEARAGRGRDCNGFEAFMADQLAPVGERARHPLPRAARSRDQIETAVTLDRGDMLVGGDLAIADDRDSDAFHDLRPATYARAFWSVSSGEWPC